MQNTQRPLNSVISSHNLGETRIGKGKCRVVHFFADHVATAPIVNDASHYNIYHDLSTPTVEIFQARKLDWSQDAMR
jgi:hypothetical protein